ncbi:MAG: hypothetical protein MHM6MM_008285 [Cercozoa sp. M6MM]
MSLSEEDAQFFRQQLSDVREKQDKLRRLYPQRLRALNNAFDELDALVAEHKDLENDHEQLTHVLHDLASRGSADCDKVVRPENCVSTLATEFFEIEKTQRELRRDVNSLEPKTGGTFISTLMGNINVRLWRKSDKTALRREYDAFKESATRMFCALALVSLLLSFFDVPAFIQNTFATLHQIWMLYFYSSLAIRENILKVNGSKIRRWWILHHYVAMTLFVVARAVHTSVVALLWDDCVVLFLLWQGVVMLVHETLSEKPADLQILVPLLFATYIGEFGFALRTFLIWVNTSSTQVLVVSLLWLTLAVGNSSTTFAVLRRKKQRADPQRQFVQRFIDSAASGSAVEPDAEPPNADKKTQ